MLNFTFYILNLKVISLSNLSLSQISELHLVPFISAFKLSNYFS